MPFEIVFPELPAGYSISSVRKGEEVSVIAREFTSSEDGDFFMSRLEGFPSEIIGMLPSESRILPSTISHMLVVFRRDKTATVYINEIEFLAQVRTKGREIERGEAVYEDDIADIGKLIIKDVNIPADAGILFLLSLGWRKGLYFDLQPLLGEVPVPRDYDLELRCGQYFTYLSFQRLFKITDDEWDKLIGQQWFPFISLKRRTIASLLNHVRSEWNIDDLLEPIAMEVEEMIPSLLRKWERNKLFEPHFTLLKQAADRFLEKDFISTTAILYPRIEGLMRTHHLGLNELENASQSNLMRSVIDANANERHPYSLLLPSNFQRYLKDVYFANFDPNDPSVLSRHTVSHGVAPAKLFSLKGAVIGLLILDQLSFYIGSPGEAG